METNGKKRTSLSVSARRHFVDNFFLSKANLIGKDSKVIDIGGQRTKKRGFFDVEKLEVEVTYVNIEPLTNPHILADAASIPVEDCSYDVVILGEVLEHVPDPLAVLRESHRILRPGGILLATVPFMYPIHADPYDFGRYAESFWHKMREEIRFESLKIERQGAIFSVIALAVQHIFLAKKRSWRPIQAAIVNFLMWLDKKTVNQMLTSWTTGFGIVYKK